MYMKKQRKIFIDLVMTDFGLKRMVFNLETKKYEYEKIRKK